LDWGDFHTVGEKVFYVLPTRRWLPFRYFALAGLSCAGLLR
jgi:hypothetical protein